MGDDWKSGQFRLLKFFWGLLEEAFDTREMCPLITKLSKILKTKVYVDLPLLNALHANKFPLNSFFRHYDKQFRENGASIIQNYIDFYCFNSLNSTLLTNYEKLFSHFLQHTC